MEKIQVSKQELLEKLRENKAIHIKEYKEVYAEYQSDTIAKMKKLLAAAKKVEPLTPIQYNTELTPPQTHAEDYEIVIQMLEFSVEDTVEIDQRQFEQYILNKWDWTRRFEMSKTAYLKGGF